MAARARKPAATKPAPPEPQPERPVPPPQSKLTAPLVDELCGYLRRGHYIHSACAFVGISKMSYFRWVNHGKDARALQAEGRAVTKRRLPYLDFLDRTELALDYGEAWLVEQTLKAAANPRDHGRWQAYMTMLERSRPDRWRRRASHEYINKPDGKPAPPPLLDISKLSDEELDAFEQLLAKAQPEADQ